MLNLTGEFLFGLVVFAIALGDCNAFLLSPLPILWNDLIPSNTASRGGGGSFLVEETGRRVTEVRVLLVTRGEEKGGGTEEAAGRAESDESQSEEGAASTVGTNAGAIGGAGGAIGGAIGATIGGADGTTLASDFLRPHCCCFFTSDSLMHSTQPRTGFLLFCTDIALSLLQPPQTESPQDRQ